MKMFCSEQLQITCNFTTFNTIAQNKNSTVKTAYISYQSRRNWNHINGGQDLSRKILSSCKTQVFLKLPQYYYSSRIYWPHWNHLTTCRWPCHFWTTVREQETITHNPARWLLIQRRSRALKSQFISRWDLYYGIGQHHYKWSRTVSIVSPVDGYSGVGHIWSNNSQQWKKNDNVTWRRTYTITWHGQPNWLE